MYCRYEDFPVVCLNRARYLPFQRAHQEWWSRCMLDADKTSFYFSNLQISYIFPSRLLLLSFSQCCATLLYNDVKIVKQFWEVSIYLVAVLTTPALTRPGGAVWARPGAVTDCSPQTWTWTWQRSTLELQTINRRSCTTTEKAPTRAFS